MSEWEKTQIKDFGRVITGYTPSTHNSKLWDGDIPFYSPADFNGAVYCFKTERNVQPDALSNDRVVQENSLMVTCIASIGKIALAKRKGISNQQINTIIFNDNFDPKYCYYLIKRNINELLKLAGTTAVPIVSKAEFEKIYLRHHSNKTEQTYLQKQQLIKKGLMEDLLSGKKKVKVAEELVTQNEN